LYHYTNWILTHSIYFFLRSLTTNSFSSFLPGHCLTCSLAQGDCLPSRMCEEPNQDAVVCLSHSVIGSSENLLTSKARSKFFLPSKEQNTYAATKKLNTLHMHICSTSQIVQIFFHICKELNTLHSKELNTYTAKNWTRTIQFIATHYKLTSAEYISKESGYTSYLLQTEKSRIHSPHKVFVTVHYKLKSTHHYYRPLSHFHFHCSTP
jgi:hypothetical protein